MTRVWPLSPVWVRELWEAPGHPVLSQPKGCLGWHLGDTPVGSDRGALRGVPRWARQSENRLGRVMMQADVSIHDKRGWLCHSPQPREEGDALARFYRECRGTDLHTGPGLECRPV